MSFGFSVGDFLTAASLIRDIVSSLRNSSTSSHHELVLELHGLQRALHEIEHLQCPLSQQAAVNGVKVAALMCQHPLDEFAGKLKKFESLGLDYGGKMGKRDKMKIWGKKVQWGFSMEEEVTKLRAYLVAHVGSLNMRLITLGLTSTAITNQRNGEAQSDLQKRVGDSQAAISETQKSVEKYGLVTDCNNSILKRLSSIVSGYGIVRSAPIVLKLMNTTEISSQLKTLVDLASKVWQSNLQIITLMINFQTTSPSPDCRYTWVQEPVRFEDALGRVIPVPSEYNWVKLEAVVVAQFSHGPGSEKVASGEYELFNSLDSSQIITRSEFESLIPGMSVTMAMIVGRYGEKSLERCAQITCKSVKIAPSEAGGYLCSICKSWFDLSQKQLPKPLRPPDLDSVATTDFRYFQRRGAGRKGLHEDEATCSESQDVYRKMRNERRVFKNVRVHFVSLPETPTVSNVRGPKAESQRQKRKRNAVARRTPQKRPPLPSPMHGSQTSSMVPPRVPNSTSSRMAINSLALQDSNGPCLNQSSAQTTADLVYQPVDICDAQTQIDSELDNLSSRRLVMEHAQSKTSIAQDKDVVISETVPNGHPFYSSTAPLFEDRDPTYFVDPSFIHPSFIGRSSTDLPILEDMSSGSEMRNEEFFSDTERSKMEILNNSTSSPNFSDFPNSLMQDPAAVNLESTTVNGERVEEIDPLIMWILGTMPAEHPGHDKPGLRSVSTHQSKLSYTPKAPSVISEPYWLAFSSAPSVWAAQSAPSEIEEYMGLHDSPNPSSTTDKARPFKQPTKERLRGRPMGGHLRPDRRKQAHEKVGACLRCKFLKRTCDKGEPCAGCQPSHARLWQVPCTRLAIKDMDYFLQDWKADYERHLTFVHSVRTVKFFEEKESDILITHGYFQILPLKSRKFHIHDPSHSEVEWTESLHGMAAKFTVSTESRACGMEGVPHAALSDYMERHIEDESSFTALASDYFHLMPFNSQLLGVIYQYYLRDRSPIVRKCLKMITAYIFTHHISLVRDDGESMAGRVEDPYSKYHGRIMAPAMINAQIICAMAALWRKLHEELMSNLAARFAGVYSGEKLRYWPEIFVISLTLLFLWEQFEIDNYFHMEDDIKISTFCKETEVIPTNVIIEMFHAISQKLPSLTDWNTAKHSFLLTASPTFFDTLTKIRELIERHHSYLVSRSQGVEFDRRDFGIMANKFVSRLLLQQRRSDPIQPAGRDQTPSILQEGHESTQPRLPSFVSTDEIDPWRNFITPF